jgi:hypothetical protein
MMAHWRESMMIQKPRLWRPKQFYVPQEQAAPIAIPSLIADDQRDSETSTPVDTPQVSPKMTPVIVGPKMAPVIAALSPSLPKGASATFVAMNYDACEAN